MSDQKLFEDVAKLATDQPELRTHLVPLLKKHTAQSGNLSVGALERGVKTLAKALEKLGLKCEVETFKAGKGNDRSGSYVEIIVEGSYTDDEGDQEEVSSYIKFIANGYGAIGKNEIDVDAGWKFAAKKAYDRILADLTKQGWKTK